MSETLPETVSKGRAASAFEAVIGLEVHLELLTDSKIFCGCSTAFGAEPNTQSCPICLGLPGVLPVLNRRVVELALRAALALSLRIPPSCKFDRKNYFYPDLPKAYQISQYDLPLAVDGHLDIDTPEGARRIGIRRLHLEEDAGKNIHPEGIGADYSLVDFNRTGVPLVEIVSEPDLRTPEEAKNYLEALKAVLQYCEVSDCKMEEGSLRCDANVSVRPAGAVELGTKVEIKNMNSFRAVQRGLVYEIERLTALAEEGRPIVQETRRYDEARGITISMRSKEEAHDYRYFPEPDLVPVSVGKEWLDEIRCSLPELPQQRKERLKATYGLSDYEAGQLVGSKAVAEFFDACLSVYPDAKTVSNWILGELFRCLNAAGAELEVSRFRPEQLIGLIKLVDEGTLSGKMAKEIFPDLFSSGKEARELVAERGLIQISDESELAAAVEKVVSDHPGPVADVRAGKDKAIGFLVGQVMKATGGKANPQLVNKLLRDRIGT